VSRQQSTRRSPPLLKRNYHLGFCCTSIARCDGKPRWFLSSFFLLLPAVKPPFGSPRNTRRIRFFGFASPRGERQKNRKTDRKSMTYMTFRFSRILGTASRRQSFWPLFEENRLVNSNDDNTYNRDQLNRIYTTHSTLGKHYET